MADQPDLTPTGRVILGMLAFGLRTGYDIKQLVDRSTRLFWAASYGQIYPELRRLEEQGLVAGRSEPTGGRPRMVYEPTEAGMAALIGWLESDAAPTYELRDEGMLKLFFSDVAEPGRRLEIVRAMRRRHEAKRAELAELEVKAAEMRPGPALTLQLGVGMTDYMIEWCRATERRLTEATEGD
jgi:DNA-binding PadR family transcriptional regulator